MLGRISPVSADGTLGDLEDTGPDALGAMVGRVLSVGTAPGAAVGVGAVTPTGAVERVVPPVITCPPPGDVAVVTDVRGNVEVACPSSESVSGVCFPSSPA